MFNAMSGMTGRNPGVIAAILNNPVYTGLIIDLLHVDEANVELLHKIKPEHVYLVTDAVTPTGTDMTQFEFAGKTLFVKEGRCVDADGVLGGAYLTMNEAVMHAVQQCGLSLATALAMASLIPAKVIGKDRELGRIQSGYNADLIYLDLQTYKCKICE